MNQYHKIQTVFKRDPETKFKTLLEGEFSLPEFEYLKDCIWEWEEKIDGTNIRVIWEIGKGRPRFGGKTDNAQIPAFLYDKLVDLFPTEKFAGINHDICLYGEGYGAKIQKGGGNYLNDCVDFVIFDARVGDWWLTRDAIDDIAKDMILTRAPVIGEGSLADMVEFVRNGFKSRWGNFMAEGVIARPKVALSTRSGHRIITKLKVKDFSK